MENQSQSLDHAKERMKQALLRLEQSIEEKIEANKEEFDAKEQLSHLREENAKLHSGMGAAEERISLYASELEQLKDELGDVMADVERLLESKKEVV